MKNLIYIIFALTAICSLWSCKDNDDTQNVWQEYTAWRNSNNNWYEAQKLRQTEDGTPYYEEVGGDWIPGQTILMHWVNDRVATEQNLVPLYNSTVATKYICRLYDGTPVDSSYLRTDSLFVNRVSKLISGWQIALQNMHVGDSVEIVVPYILAYGESTNGNIPPYSVLRFNMRLMDIPFYETLP